MISILFAADSEEADFYIPIFNIDRVYFPSSKLPEGMRISKVYATTSFVKLDDGNKIRAARRSLANTKDSQKEIVLLG